MKIEIISPEKEIYKGEISLAQLPGIDGSFEILENHAPMISALKKGKIRVKDMEGKEVFIDINSGTLEVINNVITIVTN